MSFDCLIVVNSTPQYMVRGLCVVIIQFGSLQDDISAINPQVPLELSRLTAASSLYHHKGRRVINADTFIPQLVHPGAVAEESS